MQLTYNHSRDIGREGAIAHVNYQQVDTGWVDEAGGIKPGRFVVRGTDDKDVSLPAATGEVTDVGSLSGVTLLDNAREPLDDDGYADNDPVPVMRKGRVWMLAEDAVTEGTPVFVRFTAAGAEELGRVRSDADAGDAVAAPGCSYRSSTTGADELVLVEVNLT